MTSSVGDAPEDAGEPRGPSQPSHAAKRSEARAERRAERTRRTAARREAHAAARQATAESTPEAASKPDARRSRRAKRSAKDPFVEAPRAPKSGGAARRRALRQLAASLLGAAGLLCSVVLALGALLVALGTDRSNGGFETVSSVCDVLVGPLRDVFSFTGEDAGKKETLAAWGTGSIGYLIVSLVVQRYLPPRPVD